MSEHLEGSSRTIEKRARGPIISKALGAAAMFGNFIVGAAEVGTTTLQNVAHWKDGLHNAIDGGVYGMQTIAAWAGHRVSPKVAHRLEQVSSNTLFASATVGGTISSYNLVQSFAGNERVAFQTQSLSSALASVALTGALAMWAVPKAMKKGFSNLSTAERSWMDHLKTDGVSAGVGVFASLPGNDVRTVAAAGLVAAGYEVAKFNPWRTHDHGHGHEHGAETDHHDETNHDQHGHSQSVHVSRLIPEYRQKSWLQQMQTKGRHRL